MSISVDGEVDVGVTNGAETVLDFVMWTFAFATVPALAFGTTELASRHTAYVGLLELLSAPLRAVASDGPQEVGWQFPMFVSAAVVLFGYGFVKERFDDRYYFHAASPVFPALLAAVPYFYFVHTIGGGLGMLWFAALFAAPILMMVADGYFRGGHMSRLFNWWP